MEKVYSWYCYSNINGLTDNTQTYTHRRVLRLTVERIPSFRLHNLTNQEMITNKSLLCYCIQIEFTSLVRIKTLVCYLLSVGFKQAGCVGFVFPREFFVSGFTWSVRAPSEKPLLRDVTGKALCSAVVEFVAPWFCGFGTVLDFINGWFSRWESSGPARALEGAASRSFRDVQAMFKRVRAPEEERRARRSRVVLNSPFFGHP